MSKHAFRADPEARPTSPTDHNAKLASIPTEVEARARLADFRGAAGRMTRAEFDALVAVAASAEDEMTGQ